MASAPVARVRVPSVSVRVTPPKVAGRDLLGVQVRTPAVDLDAATADLDPATAGGPRLRLG
jgi:hypothetical protein